MRQYVTRVFVIAVAVGAFGSAANAQTVDAAVQVKLDNQVNAIRAWAADPVIVAAVKAINAGEPADNAAMTEDKWSTMSILDPFVRAFSRNDAAGVLKARKGDEVSEAFISAANGDKVAFLAKTTSWCHKGKAKHDAPMAGRNWQGPIEVDKSSGVQQIQLSVPVLDGGKPIGSLVVGFAISKMR